MIPWALTGSAPSVTVFAALAVGAVSFLSPCVLPLVPGYLSAISGVAVDDLRHGDKRSITRVVGPSVIFCLSFTAIFVAMGMTATGLGGILADHRQTLNTVAGAVIVAMGVFFLCAPFIPLLNHTWHPDALMRRAGTGGPVVAGAAFAVAWTPCIGPTLAAVLATAATESSAGYGGLLLASYSAGLAIPFLLCAVAFNAATNASRWLRDRYRILMAASGVVLIAMGTLIVTDQMYLINAQLQRVLGPLGLDFLYGF